MKYRVIMHEVQFVEMWAYVEAETEQEAIDMAYEGDWDDLTHGGTMDITDREVIEVEEC